MRTMTLLIAAALSLQGCGPRGAIGTNLGGNDADQPSTAPHWDLESNREGIALAMTDAAGATAIRLLCPASGNSFLVNVPSFKPIGSEERLSFGSGGNVITLVADPRGDARHGGVTGSGSLPDDIKGLLEGPITATYGIQTSGPHPPLPTELHRQFVTACFERVDAAAIAASKPNSSTSPCLVQDGELLRMTPLKAIGTEPFWAARIEGRCVTYSTPEDQKGTRLWTRFNTGPQGGIWVGTLGGKPFVLRTRPVVTCSDGMSDNRYQIAVELTVNGEERRGCADPILR
jgi:uncharacterized membrane protein